MLEGLSETIAISDAIYICLGCVLRLRNMSRGSWFESNDQRPF
jgi:hypothetical protein